VLDRSSGAPLQNPAQHPAQTGDSREPDCNEVRLNTRPAGVAASRRHGRMLSDPVCQRKRSHLSAFKHALSVVTHRLPSFISLNPPRSVTDSRIEVLTIAEDRQKWGKSCRLLPA
jgi:hypothetical protein